MWGIINKAGVLKRELLRFFISFEEMNVRCLYLYCLAFLLFLSPLYAQQRLTVEVMDVQGNRLAYPEVSVGNYWHRVGNERGTIEIPISPTSINDTLSVKYLGYRAFKRRLDTALLSRSPLKVSLEEESYLLDSVMVLPNDFSAEELFQQRLKKSLRLYSHPFFFDLHFTVKKGEEQAAMTYTGQVLGHARRMKISLDSSSLVISKKTEEISKVLRLLKRTTEISHHSLSVFCNKELRKHFSCSYKGEEANGLAVWDFVVKEQEKTVLDLKEEEDLRFRVFLDKEGVIDRIGVQFTPIDDTASYLLDVEFVLFKGKLVPQKVTIDLISHADNAETPWSIDITYRNNRKRE